MYSYHYVGIVWSCVVAFSVSVLRSNICNRVFKVCSVSLSKKTRIIRAPGGIGDTKKDPNRTQDSGLRTPTQDSELVTVVRRLRNLYTKLIKWRSLHRAPGRCLNSRTKMRTSYYASTSLKKLWMKYVVIRYCLFVLSTRYYLLLTSRERELDIVCQP